MSAKQARTLLLFAARRVASARDVEGLRYVAESAVKLTHADALGRELRGRLAHLGVTNNQALSLLDIAGRAGEAFDFEVLAEVAATVVLREHLDQLRHEIQSRLAHLASKYGTPTPEASKVPRKQARHRAPRERHRD